MGASWSFLGRPIYLIQSFFVKQIRAVDRREQQLVAVVTAASATLCGEIESKTKENQDVCCTLQCGPIRCAGVFDGHGPYGRQAAETVVRCIANSLWTWRLDLPLDKQTETMIARISNQMKQDKRFAESGTTACFVVSSPSQLVVCNVGDSRAVLFHPRLGEYSRVEDLVEIGSTRDHKPDRLDETKRITKAGGQVRWGDEDHESRLYFNKESFRPGLSVSRALGDHAAAGLVSDVPDVMTYDFNQEDVVQPWFVVLGTDGLFAELTHREIARIVWKQRHRHVEEAAKELVCEADIYWRLTGHGSSFIDDISAVVFWLGPRCEK